LTGPDARIDDCKHNVGVRGTLVLRILFAVIGQFRLFE
jgi:hypothetical protein